jgi:S1-C subfamily serine protease
MFDGSRWFQQSGRTPSLEDADHIPFFRRHFWPPSALGIVVISIVVSMAVGFTGALIYTSSDNAQIAAVDPADQTRTLPTAPPSTDPAATTTTKPEILTPDGISKRTGPSVFSVSSLDENGSPVEGSGFVAGSFGGQTFVLTSFTVVRAATRVPGPEIVVRSGNSDIKATLWSWQEERDLALLVTSRQIASLTWADDDPPVKAGDKIYLVAGGAGGPVAGVISAVSPTTITHNIFVDARRQGAPILNERGQVLGIATLALTPPGVVPPPDTFFAVPIAGACERVLNCGGGNASVPSTVAPTGLNAANATTTTAGR